ncbi:MAG: DUF305 domain-containing protein [Bacteroidota bacterium]|nr:DUF305 domain-containing protein [Bacteroidota bacterium]
MKSTILITAALFSAGIFLQSCGNEKNKSVKTNSDTTMSNMEHKDNMDMKNMNNEMMESMNSMMTKMDAMKMTGDFDLDFANMMILHHQAAIDMSEVELAKGSDTQAKTWAQNIITAQKAEIGQMEALLKNYKMPEMKKESEEMHNELGETMKMMMDKMKAMTMSGNTDKDFVMMMIPHHESAVTMAEDEISHGKNYELKKLAQKIVADQNKEIKEFKEWLANKK